MQSSSKFSRETRAAVVTVQADVTTLRGMDAQETIVVPSEPLVAVGQVRSPLLVIVCGLAGSGKSTVSELLARAMGSAHLDKDDLAPFVEKVGGHLDGWEGLSDRESETYRHHVRPVEYEVLVNLAMSQLDVGCSVVLDAPLSAELRDRQWCEELVGRVESLRAGLRILSVTARDEERLSHIESRQAGRDVHKLAHWEEYLSGVVRGELAIEHETLVNDQGLAELEAVALGLAGQWRAGVGR